MNQNIKENIIEALGWLSDYNHQNISWFNNDQGLCYSYEENVEDIFDITGLHDDLEQGKIVFGEDADKMLGELERACDRLGYNWAGKEKELLESAEMQVIRNMASQCLAMIG